MIIFCLPHIEGSVLVFLIESKKRAVSDESGMFFGLSLPNPAVLEVHLNVLFLDRKKNHVDKHPLLVNHVFFRKDQVRSPTMPSALRSCFLWKFLIAFFVFLPILPSTGPGSKPERVNAFWTSSTATPPTRMREDFEALVWDEKLE